MKSKSKKKSGVIRTAGAIARSTPVGRVASIGLSAMGFGQGLTRSQVESKRRRRKMTLASIKKKIALFKAKKELAKVRGY